MTAIDEQGDIVGHILMNKLNVLDNSINFGHVIVAPAMRGHGFGKAMITTAVEYALHILKMKKITLQVFDNNLSALYCYKAAGFQESSYYPNCYPYKDELWGCYNMVLEQK